MKCVIPFLVLLLGGCGVSDADLAREVERISVCERDNECLLLRGPCPYHCGVVVNRTMTATLTELFGDYGSPNGCYLTCVTEDRLDVICDETAGKCVVNLLE